MPAARLWPLLVAVLTLACGPAGALTVEGHKRVHAVIGQPLTLLVPLDFTGDPRAGVEVRVQPAPGLADAEEAVAEAVHAVYDPARAAIRLSTERRVLVPAVRLHLSVSSGPLALERDLDVLVDLPDFNTQHFPARDPAAVAAAPEEVTADEGDDGVRLLLIHSAARNAAAYGDAATHDGMAAAVTQRPRPTPMRPATAQPRLPERYAVRPGDTLSGIAAKLARPYGLPAAPMKLALYEANPAAFHPAQPERPVKGAVLRVPDPQVVDSKPPEQVEAFARYTQHPQGAWQPPPSPAASDVVAEPRGNRIARLIQLLGGNVPRGILIAAAAGGALLLCVLLALRLRPLLRRSLAGFRLPAIRLPRRSGVAQPAPGIAAATDPGVEQEIRRLGQMLKEKPWRSDIRYQLAQRLYKARDAEGFGQVAPRLKSALNEEAWLRVRSMGRELRPQDPVFQA